MSQFNRFWQQSRNIICIGRNFAEHAKELSNKTPSKPFFFLKPTSSFVRHGEPIVLPIGAEVHHEVELAIIIKHKIRKVNADEALDAGCMKKRKLKLWFYLNYIYISCWICFSIRFDCKE